MLAIGEIEGKSIVGMLHLSLHHPTYLMYNTFHRRTKVQYKQSVY